MNKRILLTLLAVGCVVALAACSKHAAPPAKTTGMYTEPPKIATATLPHLVYVAQLHPLNGTVMRTLTGGRAQFAINNGKLTIRIEVTGAAPDIAHAQGIHGFLNGKTAKCPANTDNNRGDSILSLSDAEATMGTPLIPLNAEPLAMDFKSLTYPTAAANGTYTYQETVSLSALQAAFARGHNGQKLALVKDTVMIHGVSVNTRVPATVTAAATTAGTVATSAAAVEESASRSAAPVSISMPAGLPIACGEIMTVKTLH